MLHDGVEAQVFLCNTFLSVRLTAGRCKLLVILCAVVSLYILCLRGF